LITSDMGFDAWYSMNSFAAFGCGALRGIAEGAMVASVPSVG
jgi:hypothetical protein